MKPLDGKHKHDLSRRRKSRKHAARETSKREAERETLEIPRFLRRWPD